MQAKSLSWHCSRRQAEKRGVAGCLPALLIAFCVFGSSCSAKWTPFQAATYPPTQLFDQQVPVRGLRVNLASAKNSRVTGIDLGGFNQVTDRMMGIQVAAAMNYNRETHGFQYALLGCNMTEKLRGIQGSGFVHIIFGFPGINLAADMKGLQIGTGGNIAGSSWAGPGANRSDNGSGWFGVPKVRSEVDCSGGQIGFFFNRSHVGMRGFQAAGVGLNLADQTCSGVQCALFAGANIVGSELRGAQVVVFGGNIAKNDLIGIQLGAVNVADTVRGVQCGVVNLCNELRGLQIGIVNVSLNHRFPFVPLVNMRF